MHLLPTGSGREVAKFAAAGAELRQFWRDRGSQAAVRILMHDVAMEARTLRGLWLRGNSATELCDEIYRMTAGGRSPRGMWSFTRPAEKRREEGAALKAYCPTAMTLIDVDTPRPSHAGRDDAPPAIEAHTSEWHPGLFKSRSSGAPGTPVAGTRHPGTSGTPAPWHPGTLAPWHPGTLAPWHPGTLRTSSVRKT